MNDLEEKSAILATFMTVCFNPFMLTAVKLKTMQRNNTLINLTFVFVLLSCLSFKVASSPPLINENYGSGILSQTGLRHFSTLNGLSQDTVNSFYQDHQGVMWVGTDSGLNKITGRQVTLFQGPENSISSVSISQITSDKQNQLWFSTFKEVFKVSPNLQNVERFSLPAPLIGANQANYIVKLLPDNQGNMWIIEKLGIYKLDGENKEVTRFDTLNSLLKKGLKIRFAANANQHIWLGTNLGLYQFNKQRATISKISLPQELTQDTLYDVIEISRQEMYLTTNSGFYQVSDDLAGRLTLKQTLLSDDSINSVSFNTKHIYISSGDKVFWYNLTTQKIVLLFALSEILPRYTNYKIESLFVDNQGLLWIGTDSFGAFLWNPQSLHFKSLINLTQNIYTKLSNNTVWNFAEDPPNVLWLASDNGLNKINRAQGTVEHFLTAKQVEGSQLPSRLLFILNDLNNLWIGSENGIIQFNKSTEKSELFKPNSEQVFFIYSMAKGPQGNLWIASDLGLYRFNPTTKKFSQPIHGINKNRSETITLVKFLQGKLWIGHPDKLERYDFATNTIETIAKFDHPNIDEESALTDIYLQDNFIWVSHNSQGLYLLENGASGSKVVKHFNRKSGFPDNVVHAIQPHTSFPDRLLVSTHVGLIELNTTTHQWVQFGLFDGLPSNEFNEGASLKGNNGELLFGLANGFIEFNPQHLKLSLESPKVIINSLIVGNERSEQNLEDWHLSNVKMKSDSDLLFVNVSVLDYMTPERWHYEYWLSGDRQTDPRTQKSNKITIANIPVGQYQLNIRPIIPNYKVYPSVTQVNIEVVNNKVSKQPLLYLGFAIIILILSFYLIQRIKFNQRLAEENKKLSLSEQRIKTASIDNFRGVWEWQLQSHSIDNSTITLLRPNNESLVLTLSQFKAYIFENDRAKVKAAWEALLKGKESEFNLEFKIYLFEQWRWCKVFGKISERLNTGKPCRVSGTWFDNSADKEVLNQLSIYQQAINSTRDIVFILDEKFTIVSVNEAYQKLTGYPAEKIINRSFIELANRRLNSTQLAELEEQLVYKKQWQDEASMPISGGASYAADIRIDAIENATYNAKYIVLITDISSLNKRFESEVQNSYYDDVTGLPNQVLASDRLSHAIAHARLHQTQVGLLYLDLDKFNFLNQTLGKSAAREILVTTSKRIRSTLNKDDTLARIEGDKFHIIFENVEQIEQLAYQASQILSEISRTQKVANTNVNLTASVGIAYYPHDAKNSTKLVKCAYEAMKTARAGGTNRINFFHREINQRALDRLAMRDSLERALDGQQLYLVFQPKFELNNRLLGGFEVFVRWKTEQGNIVYPSQFIKLAEEIGIIDRLTEWLIESAIKTLANWKAQGVTSTFSINVNPKYCHKPEFSELILSKLKKHNIAPLCLQIELNEKEFSQDLTQNLELIQRLKNGGLNVTLDDFGTGNTPLNHLKQINVSSIKLERNFIRNIGKDVNNDLLLKSILQLMNDLGKSTAAKGIEYESQLSFLKQYGCQFGQGYYFSDPLSEEKALHLALNNKV
ncbi:EAL domain-containing protein [Aliikangiella sp. IMCC44632]